MQGFQGLVNIIKTVAPGILGAGKAISDVDSKVQGLGKSIGALPSVVKQIEGGSTGIVQGITVNVPPIAKGERELSQVERDSAESDKVLNRAVDASLISSSLKTLQGAKSIVKTNPLGFSPADLAASAKYGTPVPIWNASCLRGIIFTWNGLRRPDQWRHFP